MSIDETVSFSLEVNVEKAYEDIRRVQTVLYRTIGLIKQMSGDENMDNLINKAQAGIATLNQLRLTIIALQAASGPVGWALALIGLMGTMGTAGPMVRDVMGWTGSSRDRLLMEARGR